MCHVHTDMRFGVCGHPHAPARLHAENPRQTVVVQHFCPRGIGQNHHFAHQRVDGRTAFTAHNHHLAVGIKVDAVIVFFRSGRVVQPVALFLLLVGQLQQVQAFGVIRELRMVCAARAGFAVEKRFDVLDAQIGGNRHHFNPAHRFGQPPFRVHVEINAERGHGFAFVQAVRANPVVRQHGDFSCGEIDRAPAFENQLLDAAVGFDGQRWRGDVDADALHAVAQILHRQCVVHFGGGYVVNRKRLHIGQRQICRLLLQRDFGGLRAVREIFNAEALQQVFGQRRHAAGVFGQFVCRHFQAVGRFLEGFVGQGLFVGLVQDVRQVGGHRVGQPACG